MPDIMRRILQGDPPQDFRGLGSMARVAMPRAALQRRGIHARYPSRFGRGPTRWRADHRCAQPARTSSAGVFAGSVDAPRARPSSRAVRPLLGTARRCCTAPGSRASRYRTASATSITDLLGRSCCAPSPRVRGGLWMRRRPRRVPVGTGTASALASLDQAALTSIILGVATCGAGTLTSSMPFAYFASTWATSTPSGSSKVRWNAPYASSRRK
jgi:hypothetical protein